MGLGGTVASHSWNWVIPETKDPAGHDGRLLLWTMAPKLRECCHSEFCLQCFLTSTWNCWVRSSALNQCLETVKDGMWTNNPAKRKAVHLEAVVSETAVQPALGGFEPLLRNAAFIVFCDPVLLLIAEVVRVRLPAMLNPPLHPLIRITPSHMWPATCECILKCHVPRVLLWRHSFVDVYKWLFTSNCTQVICWKTSLSGVSNK